MTMKRWSGSSDRNHYKEFQWKPEYKGFAKRNRGKMLPSRFDTAESEIQMGRVAVNRNAGPTTILIFARNQE
jgi:hypothetical protein